MSMAHDNTSRAFRSKATYRRGTQGSGEPPGDPLAELARLIGQPDPFPGSRRSHQRDSHEERPADWRRTAAAMPAYETYPEEPEGAAQYQDEAPPRRPRRPDPYFAAAADPPYQRREPYHMAAAVEEPIEDGPASGYRQEPQYDDAEEFRQDDRRYQDDQHYPAVASREPRMEEPYFDLGEPVTAQDEDMYDDPPPRARGRGGLITAVT